MDILKIKQIITLFEESKLASMELEVDDIKIKMDKATATNFVQMPVVSEVTQAQPVVEVKASVDSTPKETIKSPLVGTYYSSPAPDAKPFVEVGKKINKGDVICIVEAMKVMNEIKADKSGVVKEILCQSGDVVQYDQDIIVVEA